MFRVNRHIVSGSRIFTFQHPKVLLRFSALFLNSEVSLYLCHGSDG